MTHYLWLITKLLTPVSTQKRAYPWRVMRRMALPTGINVPGWKVLYQNQLDQKSLDVKIGEISFEQAKTQEIPTGTIVLATHGSNLMV